MNGSGGEAIEAATSGVKGAPKQLDYQAILCEAMERVFRNASKPGSYRVGKS